MDKPRRYGAAADRVPASAYAKGAGGSRAGMMMPRGMSTSPQVMPTGPPAPPPVSLDLNDFKGSFSFDNFFNTLVGDLLPTVEGGEGAGASQQPPTLSLSASGVVGFPEAEAFVPRFKEARLQLLELSRKVEDKLERLRKDVAAQDTEHKETLGKLERGVEGLFDSFGRLDARISGVGQTAARIGDHLQSADAQRETAKHIIELIQYLMDFNKEREDFAPSDSVFSDPKRMGEAATIARKLRALAEEDEDAKEMVPGEGRRGGPSASAGLEVAVQNLNEYCNDLENKLLQKFDAAAQKKDRATMAECAKIMEQFHSGDRAIHRYVTTRPMFWDVEVMNADIRIATGETGSSIANVVGLVNPTRGLTNLYKQIIDTVKEEAATVAEVFPTPKQVMKILIQRVLLQRVQRVLEHLLKDPNFLLDNPPPVEQGGMLNYLRTLASAYEKTIDLSKQLLEVGCGDLDVEATAESLFDEHKSLYHEVEQASLMQHFHAKYAEELEAVTNSLLTDLSSSQVAAAGGAAGLRSRGTAQAPQAGGVGGAGSGGLGPSGLVTECVRWNEEAIGRCKVITPEPKALVENVTMVFGVLLDQVNEFSKAILKHANDGLAEAALLKEKSSIGTAVHRRVALAAAAAAEQAAIAGEQSIRVFLMAVKLVTANMAAVHQHFVTSVGPALMVVEGMHGKAVDDMAAKMGETETMALRGLQVCIETAVGEVERVLQTEQKPTEFRPPEDGSLPDHRPTTACIKVRTYLEKVVESVQMSLDGPNRVAFLLELGSRLHKCLLAHVQRFTFNPGGGLRLKRDVSEYAEFVRTFKTPSVDEQFESLGALVNLFIVGPDTLRNLVDSSNMSHKDALVYIQLRDDYRSARIANQFAR